MPGSFGPQSTARKLHAVLIHPKLKRAANILWYKPMRPSTNHRDSTTRHPRDAMYLSSVCVNKGHVSSSSGCHSGFFTKHST